MKTHLTKQMELAITDYVDSQPGLIVLSDAVTAVLARSEMESPRELVREALAARAIAKGRSVHFDRLAQEAT